MNGDIVLIVIVLIIRIAVELVPQLEIPHLCHFQVNLLLDQNLLVDIIMRDVVDQREQERVFIAHQHHRIFFVACPTFLKEILQEILVDVGVCWDGLYSASEVYAICSLVDEALQVGSGEGSLLRSKKGRGAEFCADDECWLRCHEELIDHSQIILLIFPSIGDDGKWINPIQKCSIELFVGEGLPHQRQFIVHDWDLLVISLFSVVKTRSIDIFPKLRKVPTFLQLSYFLENEVDSVGCSVKHHKILGCPVSEDDQVMWQFKQVYKYLFDSLAGGLVVQGLPVASHVDYHWLSGIQKSSEKEEKGKIIETEFHYQIKNQNAAKCPMAERKFSKEIKEAK